MAKKYHPDINKDHAGKFKQILESYQKLKDPLSRKIEDFASSEKDENSRKYYQNKYYNYTKPHEDLRNEHLEQEKEESMATMALKRVGLQMMVITLTLIGYEYYFHSSQKSYSEFLDFQNELRKETGGSHLSGYIQAR